MTNIVLQSEQIRANINDSKNNGRLPDFYVEFLMTRRQALLFELREIEIKLIETGRLKTSSIIPKSQR